MFIGHEGICGGSNMDVVDCRVSTFELHGSWGYCLMGMKKKGLRMLRFENLLKMTPKKCVCVCFNVVKNAGLIAKRHHICLESFCEFRYISVCLGWISFSHVGVIFRFQPWSVGPIGCHETYYRQTESSCTESVRL